MLHAKLMPHQQQGVEWLVKHEYGGCILADDMGLGKTVQCCALMCECPLLTLVIAPLALLGQWKSEIHKHTSLSVAIHHGTQRFRNVEYHTDVILTTPQTVNNDFARGALDVYTEVGRVIIDEAHRLKNAKSAVHKGVKMAFIDVPHKIIVTGTPICNSMQDLISLIQLLNREPYSKEDYWMGVKIDEQLERTYEFSNKYVLRRTKEKEMPNVLPECTIHDVYGSYVGNQSIAYQNCLHNHSAVISKIARLRQISNDTSLLPNATGFTEMSWKVGHFVSLIENIPEDEKVVVFSQWTRMLDKLQQTVDPLCKRSCMYHGKMTVDEKDAAIVAFKNDKTRRILFVSLKSGGCGLNLVEANHAVIVEPYFNYAEEKQAIDRVYRIGQTKPVHVYRMYGKSNIESWMQQLQATKKRLAEKIIDNNGTIHEVKTSIVVQRQMFECFVLGMTE